MFNLSRLWKSFGYALKGIRILFSGQANAQIHALAVAVVAVAGFHYRLSSTEWALVVFATALVLSAEAMNTAVETLTDLASPERHELAEKTKDVAAGAVLIAAIGAAVIGGLVFLPKVFTSL